MTNTSKFYQLLLLMSFLMVSIKSQTLDELKSKMINEWKSIALELVPSQQGEEVFPTYERRQWNFTENSEFLMKFERFSDKSGANRIMTFDGSGIVTFQGASNVIEGAFLCQFHMNKSLVLTLHTDDLVSTFNSYEKGNIAWVKDKPQDITLLSVPAFNKLAGQYFIGYDILYIKDNYLYMGDVDALGNEASIDQPSRGLCAPLIPFSDDTTPLTLEELKQEIVKGVWISIAKEVRPGLDSQGQVTTTFQTRQFTFPTDSSFNLVVTSFPGPGQTDALTEFEIVGKLEWEGDASAVVSGAQFAQFIVNELYLTPKTEQLAAQFNQNLPQGIDPFKVNQKTNLTQKDFPAFGLTKDSQIKENDLLYQRENRLFLGARPVDGRRPFPTERRTYSLSDDLIDPERTGSNPIIIFMSILIFSIWI
ncbi:unnamed protein product [Paramecium sonneborni]|uniref:APCDD1 domain-containing protein n=1 Tax=Paramecium sonneborni TaxID=65129 RepID=A0A8S1QT81_9CILI|nr:unnamed protein product [Paramecium sonneborni]